MKRILPLVIILAVLGIALGAGWWLTRPETKSVTPSPAPSVASNTTKPSTPNPVRTDVSQPGAEPPHSVGSANAPVTLEEFGDFQCPPCGLLHPVLKDMEKEFGPRLRVVFREYPLVPTHPHALTAARAAEAAGLQGKFWEMHDMLFTNQRTWHAAFDAKPIFEDYAIKIGLDLEKFRRDVNSSVVEQRIFLDGKRAHALGVNGTPTVFMNGREVPFESLAPEQLRPLIQAELNAKGQ